MKKLRIGFIGAKHTHYIDFSGYVKESPYCEIAGVWADEPEKAEKWAEKAGTKAVSSYIELLQDETVDGVVIASTPFQHEEHIIATAKHGKAIFVEQPFAVTVEAAERIRDAIEENGVPFVLSNPVKRSNYVFVKELIDAGLLGDILNVRVRSLHDNTVKMLEGKFPEFEYVYDRSQSGGGAMNNMGFHGVKLLRWLLGMPVSACGIYTSFSDIGKENNIEENAVVSFKFPSGAIGTIETGWIHPRYQSNFEVNGTHGTVIQSHDGLYYHIDSHGDEWVKVNPKLLPAAQEHPMTYWIDHLRKGEPMDEFGADEAVELTRMVVAAYESQGNEIEV